MKQSVNIQDQFLNQLRKDGINCTVFLLNGFQIRGQIKGFDNFTILLESEGKNNNLYTNMPFQHSLHNETLQLR